MAERRSSSPEQPRRDRRQSRTSTRTLEEAYDPADYQRLDGPGRYAVLLKDAGMIQAVGERHMVEVAAQPAEGRDTLEAVTRLAGLVLDRLEQGAGAGRP